MEIERKVVIVETSVWVDFFRGIRNPHTEWVLDHAGEQSLGILDVILCEVLQGAARPAEYALMKRRLLAIDVYDCGGQENAVESAANYLKLRKKGISIRTTIDCMIATYCIRHGFALLHRDRDFDPFEAHLGLRVVRPRIAPVQ